MRKLIISTAFAFAAVSTIAVADEISDIEAYNTAVKAGIIQEGDVFVYESSVPNMVQPVVIPVQEEKCPTAKDIVGWIVEPRTDGVQYGVPGKTVVMTVNGRPMQAVTDRYGRFKFDSVITAEKTANISVQDGSGNITSQANVWLDGLIKVPATR